MGLTAPAGRQDNGPGSDILSAGSGKHTLMWNTAISEVEKGRVIQIKYLKILS
jgi:hypothetical protein